MIFDVYFITKKYKLSLQETLYEEALNDNIKDLLKLFAERKNIYQWDDFFFIIVWNDKTNNWNKNIPFLSTQNFKKAILEYMTLLELKELNLIGTTTFVFRYCKIYSFILIFEIGNSFQLRKFIEDGIIIIKVTLPEISFLDISNIQIPLIPHKILERLNNDIELLQIIEGENLQIDKTTKDKLNTYLNPNKIGDKNYEKFIENFISSLCIRPIDIRNGTKKIEILKHLHSMFVMLYTLMKKTNKNKKLVYIFHTSLGKDGTKSFILPLGSICFMTPLDEIDYFYFWYINSFLSISPNCIIQKIYQQNLIINHALRSAVAAIMARNMSHNIGSHVLNYLSNPEELDKLWII